LLYVWQDIPLQWMLFVWQVTRSLSQAFKVVFPKLCPFYSPLIINLLETGFIIQMLNSIYGRRLNIDLSWDFTNLTPKSKFYPHQNVRMFITLNFYCQFFYELHIKFIGSSFVLWKCSCNILVSLWVSEDNLLS
jgi:hypothetical protein